MPRTDNPGHLAKLFSSAVFSAFLSDLDRWEADGLRPELHAAVSRWLAELTDVAASIPDGNLIGRKVHERCDDLARAYREWHESGDEGRRSRKRRKLRKRINALATAYRVRAKLLEDEVDLRVLRAMYEATARLLLIVPGSSSALGRVVRSFARRLPGAS